MTGGTISQKAVDGKMQISYSAQDLLSNINTSAEFKFIDLAKESGADLMLDHIFEVRDLVVKNPDFDGYLLITGTDSMEELAFALDILLEPRKPFVITGAIKPTDLMGYDGGVNLCDALKVIESPESANLGVLVVINDNIHPARYLRKHDSALFGAFQSHPGPIGQIRRGKALFYYFSLPPLERYANARRELVTKKVLIWTMVIDPILPEVLLQNIDGLIIAGMGTGSVANSIVNQLSPTWTSQIPIVITSRCPVGLNYDDYCYRGSLKKYENKGFHILGFEYLNPLQARLKLIFQRASPST